MREGVGGSSLDICDPDFELALWSSLRALARSLDRELVVRVVTQRHLPAILVLELERDLGRRAPKLGRDLPHELVVG
jgi:hypothetical protein